MLPSRTRPQRILLNSKTRFNVAAWGRQSGKTTAGLQKLFIKSLNSKADSVYWYILQTHSAADVAFNRFIRMYPRNVKELLFDKNPNASEKTVFLKGNIQVGFKSGSEYDNLRIETLNGVIIDECREQPLELWSQVVRPMLAKHKGWADFYSTPNGYDWFYDIAMFAMDHPLDWTYVHAPSSEAPWWTKEELDSAKASMTESEYRQEILAEFLEYADLKVYLNHGLHNQLNQCPFYPGQYHSALPIYVAMDFNINPMAWTLGQKKLEKAHFFDELWIRNTTTMQASEALVQKYFSLNLHPNHRKDIGIILCGDATSKSRQRGSGESDYQIIENTLNSYGIKYSNITPDSNPQIKDRINLMNVRLKSASGDVAITYNPKNCPRLGKDFERVRWKQATGSLILDQYKDPDLTHSSDGVGYLICATDSLKQSAGNELYVIRRNY